MYMRLRSNNLSQRHLPSAVLTSLEHPDSDRVEHYRIKNKKHSMIVNRIYRLIKEKIILASGSVDCLSEEARMNLYARCERWTSTMLSRRGSYNAPLVVHAPIKQKAIADISLCTDLKITVGAEEILGLSDST